MEITPGLAAVLGTLAGVVLTSAFSLINTYISKKSDERKHNRELIINAAIENRRQTLEINKVAPEGFEYVRSIDDYIVHMIALSEVLLDKKLDKATIASRVDELEDFLATFDEARAKKYPEYVKQIPPQPAPRP